ncbi:hypothetical protein [Phenylobacterium sp. J367]|uniref:hypothetical protein n=1 Tax=Phenylobacterium sp. J367 TaxID=2898435 RepID=UPI002150907B|nr:hypothetical protein [Phenylobacterium sp. J367]
MKLTIVAASALAALSLAACEGATGTAPQDSAVAAAMPDTEAPKSDNMALTTPDAGATGRVPADGSPPPVSPTPPQGTAGGSPGVVGAPSTENPSLKN